VVGKQCHIRATSFLHDLDLDLGGNSLGVNLCSQAIGSLDFGVSLVLDCSVNPSKINPSKILQTTNSSPMICVDDGTNSLEQFKGLLFDTMPPLINLLTFLKHAYRHITTCLLMLAHK
jgi:hypothetical protein